MESYLTANDKLAPMFGKKSLHGSAPSKEQLRAARRSYILTTHLRGVQKVPLSDFQSNPEFRKDPFHAQSCFCHPS